MMTAAATRTTAVRMRIVHNHVETGGLESVAAANSQQEADIGASKFDAAAPGPVLSGPWCSAGPLL
jgi:hypothetical protein